MSVVGALSEADLGFLAPYLPPDVSPEGDLPFVTLTYASSLDSMISLGPGLRTTLSGPETKNMTHYLRLKHQAILVGVGTAIPDDPALNCRYPGAQSTDQPQPIIIDPRERWQYSGSKLKSLVAKGEGKAPWIVRIAKVIEEDFQAGSELRTITLPSSESPDSRLKSLAWIDILRALKREGIKSVMIEGGATIISSMLKLPDLVSSVIVTIAPTWLGREGVFVSPVSKIIEGERVNAASLHAVEWRQFGQDAVLCGRFSGK